MKKPFILLVQAFFVFASTVCFAQSVWFCPDKADFLYNRSDDSKWVPQRAKLSVYQYYCGQVQSIPLGKLKEEFNLFKESGVKIALECPPLVYQDVTVEGFGRPGVLMDVANKIKSAGGQIDFLTMDEPLFFAHYPNTGKTVFGWDYDKIASNAAANMKEIRKLFPDVKVGEVEPIQKISPADAGKWFQAYEKYSGKKLDFFHADVVWGEPTWRSSIPALKKAAEANGIKFGVILNSTYPDADNDAWIASAQNNIDNYLNLGVGSNVDYIIQSWNKNPVHIIPGSETRGHLSLVGYLCMKTECRR